MESTPRSCFCCGRGRTKIQVQVSSTIRRVNSENVIYVGETITINLAIDNSQNPTQITDVLVDLVQNLFVTANCGATRTFKRVKKAIKSDGVQSNGTNAYALPIVIQPEDIEAPSAIGTIVANYYTLEVTARVPGFGLCNLDEPYVSSPIYIMSSAQQPLYPPTQPPPGNFTFMKLQQFHSPPFVFRQNRKLTVMNYEYGSTLHL